MPATHAMPEETIARGLAALMGALFRWRRRRKSRYVVLLEKLDAIDAKLTRLLALWDEPPDRPSKE